jgi:hypothetical protein
MPNWKKVIVSGSAGNLSSLSVDTFVSASTINANQLTGSLYGTASQAVSSSYAATATVFPFTGSAIISGSLRVTGSINVSQGITGSLFGTAATASFVTTAQTASFVLNAVSASRAVTSSLAFTNLYTASVSSNVITFTEGDGTTFNLTVATGSGTNTVSSSFAVSSSQAANATLFNSLSSSQFPQLVQNNAFTGNNVFANITASNAQFNTASIQYLNVIYETASVIYSSGSNQFGDASNDTQTLWGTVDIKTGPVLVTGSLNVSGGITGSHLGTSSYATNGLSSSLATTNLYTASVSNNVITFTEGDGTTFSLTVATGSGTNTVSSSFANSASFAATASFVTTAQTASYVLNAISSSYALSASQAILANTASFVITAQTASFVLNAVSASRATSALNADTASFVLNAVSASYAATASFANSFPDQGFNFTQTVGTASWTINHNLNSFTPLVDVYDASYNQLIPAGVTSITANTTQITFSTAQAGFAIISKGSGISSQTAISASFATTASYASTVGVNFVQSSPSTTWTINHNLNNRYPLVQTYGNDNLVLIPQSISGSSVNTTIITFSTAISGYARVI